MNIPDELMGTIMQRHEEAKSVIDFPYQPADEEKAPRPSVAAAEQLRSRLAVASTDVS